MPRGPISHLWQPAAKKSMRAGGSGQPDVLGRQRVDAVDAEQHLRAVALARRARPPPRRRPSGASRPVLECTHVSATARVRGPIAARSRETISSADAVAGSPLSYSRTRRTRPPLSRSDSSVAKWSWTRREDLLARTKAQCAVQDRKAHRRRGRQRDVVARAAEVASPPRRPRRRAGRPRADSPRGPRRGGAVALDLRAGRAADAGRAGTRRTGGASDRAEARGARRPTSRGPRARGAAAAVAAAVRSATRPPRRRIPPRPRPPPRRPRRSAASCASAPRARLSHLVDQVGDRVDDPRRRGTGSARPPPASSTPVSTRIVCEPGLEPRDDVGVHPVADHRGRLRVRVDRVQRRAHHQRVGLADVVGLDAGGAADQRGHRAGRRAAGRRARGRSGRGSWR